MALVGDTVDVAAAPPRDQVEVNLERTKHGPYDSQGKLLQAPVLEPQHGVPTHPCLLRHIGLAPADAKSNGPNASAESLIVHAGMMVGGPFAALTRPMAISQRGARISRL